MRQDRVQIGVVVDQRFRDIELDWIRAHTDNLDYLESSPGQWAVRPSRFDCSKLFSTVVNVNSLFFFFAFFGMKPLQGEKTFFGIKLSNIIFSFG